MPESDLAVFDFTAFVDAFDAERQARGLGWYEFAEELWDQSDRPQRKPPGRPLPLRRPISRLRARGATSCQYALFMLRWLDRAPEDFLTGPTRDVGDTRLPKAGPNRRLRWNLNALHSALNDQRQRAGLTWSALADEIGYTPSRLTNLRTARLADLELTMRTTQWLTRPAAAFIHPAQW